MMIKHERTITDDLVDKWREALATPVARKGIKDGKRSIKPWQVRRLAVNPYGMPPASLDSKAGAYSSPADSWVFDISYSSFKFICNFSSYIAIKLFL